MKVFLRKIWESIDAHDDTDYMSDASAALNQGTNPLARIMLHAALALALIAFVWAYFAKLDEVTVGTGKVIPSSQVQVIQNLEGGILRELLVSEGSVVDKDQVLARIDDTQFASSYRDARNHYLAMKARVERLEAEAQGWPLKFSEEIRQEAPDAVQGETELYQSRKRELGMGLSTLQRSYELADAEYQMSAPLVDKGALSEVEVLRLKRQVNEMGGRISDRRNAFRTQAQDELNKALVELSHAQETGVASKDRMTRTTVRSPVRGVIKKIDVTSIGGVIQPGRDIMEVVPLEDNLLVEAQVKPSDIAFIHPGQSATVKLTAYDYSIYGGLPGIVEHISADAILDEKREQSYYKVRVRTQANYLSGPAGRHLPIIPGMTASVDVLTGKKSVLDYLLKPILKAKHEALRER